MSVRPRAVVLVVFTVALTLLALRILESAGRVLGWLAMASAAAALVTPLVNRMSSRLPRGVAVACITGAALAGVGLIGYRVASDVVQQVRILEREAPRAAARVERSGPLATIGSDLSLEERTRDVVGAVPERLRGGSVPEAARSAATRGLAFLAVTVLTVFLVLHGPRLLDGARRQLHDEEARATAARLTEAVSRRALGYARGSLLMAALAGLVAYVTAVAVGVPAPAPLAIWVVLWDLVPIAGALAGALPIIVLAFVSSPVEGALVAAVFLALQLGEELLLQRPLERRTVNVGPFLTLAAGVAGIELYGIAGGLLGILAVAAALVVAEEVGLDAERVRGAHGHE